MQLLLNPGLDRRRPYGYEERKVLGLERSAAVHAEVASWPGYAPTPLRDLPALAAALEVAAIRYKDEASRFGLQSFKALGGPYGVLEVLRRELGRPQLRGADLAAGACIEEAANVTVTCATDGNHGRAVAWGAAAFGCRSVIFLPAPVSACREAAIRAHGAEIVRLDGDYDDAVRHADREARRNGWHVVSDQSYPGYEDIPRHIMQGYTVMMREVLEVERESLTHVFVQGGVGGLAAAVLSVLWEKQGPGRPLLVVVEPMGADCLCRSAAAGRPVTVPGPHDTFMACLACGEPSMLAWRLLAPGADAFLSIADRWAEETMRLLASPERTGAQVAIVAGESGAAALAGLRAAAAQPETRRALRLDSDSRILVFGTEGATDPEIYARTVSRRP